MATDDPVQAVGDDGMAARLRAVRARSFVGRQAEIDLFDEALTNDVPPFAVLHVHGPGGVGKSALLRRFADHARAVGFEPVLLDGRGMDASPIGFRAVLGSVLGVAADEVLAAFAGRERPVLLIDTYEVLTPLDGWLRDEVIPQLAAGAIVVLAGRDPPTAEWRADAAWTGLLRVVGLRELRSDDARALLAERGIAASRHDDVLRITRGHPLALVLIADAVDEHDNAIPDTLADAPGVIEALLARFLRHVPSEIHSRALHVAAQVGIASEGLLRDSVEGAPADELFDWLRGLSFTEPVAGGIAVHDLVGDALNAELRWRDPEGWAELHRTVTRHLEGRIRRSTGLAQQRAVLDLLQLYRFHPVTRGFYDWDRTEELWLEPAVPADHDGILALVREYEGEESVDIARYWLDRQPGAFTVFRGGRGDDLAGFVGHVVLRAEPGDELDADPVARAVWQHIRACGPMRATEQVRIMRFWIARATYQDVATHHLVSARSSLDWSTTDRLAWAFVVLSNPDLYEPIFRFIDFDRAPDLSVTVGDRSYGTFARDFRSTSERAWRNLLQERRVRDDATAVFAPPEENPLVVLAHDEFVAAVRDALRGLARPGGLDDNPLLRSRVTVETARGRPPQETLEAILTELVDELTHHPRDEKKHRALVLTYLRPAPTQEATAELLGLPFSTFRRHLTSGIDHVASRMWELELHGGGP